MGAKIEYSISFDLLIDLRDFDLYRDHTHIYHHLSGLS
jgi:hypothetical protein